MEEKRKGIYNANDSLDINELAALSDDISDEFIEELRHKVSKTAGELNARSDNTDDSGDITGLFEEVGSQGEEKPAENAVEKLEKQPEDSGKGETEIFDKTPVQEEKPVKIQISETIDDNFIKKYRVKLNKQQNTANQTGSEEQSAAKKSNTPEDSDSSEIENLTNGNIIEKPASKAQIDYNESLNFLDNNIKYSKYVIYIDPENTEFIESLTVKERKNLINKVLKEQGDIAITKRRLGRVQTIIKHLVTAIITIAISIPVVYFVINVSLEASINNYKRLQLNFQTLYREKGKIKQHSNN